MRASIIAVGSELLTPFRADTNSLAITARLNAIGFDVRFKAIVGDDVDELAEVLTWTLGADLIVLTGGLGPTADDITREAVSRVLDLPLGLDETVLASIARRFAGRGLPMAEINRRQAMVPRGAVVLENPNGTAPGLWLERGRTAIVLLPGPPREMGPMLDALVRDRLAARAGASALVRRVVRVAGRTESDVDATVQPIYGPWRTGRPPIETTILAVPGQIELHLTARADAPGAADRVLDEAVRSLREALGESVYAVDDRPLEAVVGELLQERGLTVGVAESCTGGLLFSRLTDVPGSSAYMVGGVVCYSDQAKIEWLGVPEAMIRAEGAVSEGVAQALAEGIRRRAGTRVGIGVTGIAGPGGGTPAKPVGTVFVAVLVDGERTVRRLSLVGDRGLVKFQSAQAGLNLLRLMLLAGRGR